MVFVLNRFSASPTGSMSRSSVRTRRANPIRRNQRVISSAWHAYSMQRESMFLLHAWGRMMHAPEEWRAALRPRLLLVGEGPLRSKLKRIAARTRHPGQRRVPGAGQGCCRSPTAKLGVCAALRWGGYFSNALLKAMACGLPSVATRVSGSEDIITHGLNGLLVEPEHPADLARALQRIIANSSLARGLAQEGRSTVLRDYPLSAIVDRCLDLYRRLLKKDQGVVPISLEGVAKW